MKQLAGQFTRGLQGGALFRTSIYHSHSVEEVLDRIEEYFSAILEGRPYYGEAGAPIEEAPALDSCEAALDSCEAALDSCEPALDSCEAALV
jgi:hypothetical protein